MTKTTLLCGAAIYALSLGAAVAQSAASSEDETVRELDRVVVTGSFIRRSDADSASPLQTLDGDSFQIEAATTPADVVRNLSINTGSQFNSDAQSQGGGYGTAQFNLRGLGLNSTLVLLDGKRQTAFALSNADGDTFVDINSLVPLIAVDRVEILKDGAAALYGSDAVAGVANFITRSNLDGVELEAGYQTVTEGGQRDYSLSGIAGRTGDWGHVFGAFSYLDRSDLSASERSFTAGQNVSNLGQPGSFQPVIFPVIGGVADPTRPAIPIGPPQADPLCGDPDVGGTVIPIGPPPAALCRGDFSDFNSLVPEEERLQLFASLQYDLTDDDYVYGSLGYATSEARVDSSPSFPIVTFPTIPANNPGNTFTYATPFGPPGSGQFAGDPAALIFRGRALGPDNPPVPLSTDQDLYRGSLGVHGRVLSSDTWVYDLSLSYSRSDVFSVREDIIRDEFEAALAGRGGPNGDQFFNPFGNASIAVPGDPRFNDPAVIDGFLTDVTADIERELTVIDTVLTGDVFSLGDGRMVALALGAQYRDEQLDADLDDITNSDGLLFFLGDPDYGGERDVYAVFAEASLPLTDTLEIQLAARYEDYGSGVDSVDPKLAFLWRPNDWFVARGSIGTSFRAPNLFQLFGFRTSVNELFDPTLPAAQQRIFRPVRTESNAELQPEEAETLALGSTFRPMEDFEVSFDYWRFEFSDRIVRLSPQGILNADPLGSRVIRDPATGEVTRIDAPFVNAAAIETDGLDVRARYVFDLNGIGDFELTAEGTYAFSYDIQEVEGGPVIDGIGSRNFANSGVAAPDLRATASLVWNKGPWSAAGFARYISSFDDDSSQPSSEIESFTTFDAQLSYDFDRALGFANRVRLTIGAINLFDEAPPEADSTLGYEPTVHDPRGQLVYGRIGIEF